jgi:hypothetical protein
VAISPHLETLFLFLLEYCNRKISLGIHAAQCNLGVLLCEEVKHQLLVRMATGHVVDYDSGLPIVSSLDPESLQDSQLRAD